MSHKSRVVFAGLVGLVLIVLLAQRFLTPSAASPALGFGNPASHADATEPDAQRQRLEDVANLAAQQAAVTKQYNKANFIA